MLKLCVVVSGGFVVFGILILFCNCVSCVLLLKLCVDVEVVC